MGVILGSGIGGLASAEEPHEKALRLGFDGSPLFRPADYLQHRGGYGEHPLRGGGAQLGAGRGLLHRSTRHRRGVVVHPFRPHGCVICGAAEAAMTPLASAASRRRALSARNDDPRGPAGRSTATGMASCSVRVLASWFWRSWGPRGGGEPRSSRNCRLRGQRERPAPHPARPRMALPQRPACAGPPGRRSRARGHRLRQRPRHLDAAQRRARDASA